VIATVANPETLERAQKELPGVEFVASDASDIDAMRPLGTKVVWDHGASTSCGQCWNGCFETDLTLESFRQGKLTATHICSDR
jgi:hypothetical protein